MKNKILNIQFSEQGSEPMSVKVDPHAHSKPPEPTKGHFYSFDFFGPIGDLQELAQLLLLWECPEISAIDAAHLKAGGKLEESEEE